MFASDTDASSETVFEPAGADYERTASWLVVLGAWLAYAGVLLSPGSQLYLYDTFGLDVPMRVWAARQMRSGVFPHWCPDAHCGFPLLSEGQTGVLYPLFLMYALWPRPETNDWFIAVHLLLVGVFSHMFLLRHVRPLAAAVGAATFMGGAYLRSNSVVPSVLAAGAWLPLALWLIDGAAAGRKKWWLWCAATNAASLLAGHPFITLAVYTIELAYLLTFARAGGLPHLLRVLATVFVLPLALAAVQIFPLAEFALRSNRVSGFGTALTWERFVVASLPLSNLLTFFLPDIWGGEVGSHDAGSTWPAHFVLFHGYLAVILVPLGAWRFRGDRRTWFWAACAVLGLLVACDTPVMWLLYWIPPYNIFRGPVRYALATSWAISVLSAFGMSALLNLLIRRFVGCRWLPAMAVCIAAVAAASGVQRGWSNFLTKDDFYRLASPTLRREARDGEHFRLLPSTSPLFRLTRAYQSEPDLRKNAASLPVAHNLLFDVPCCTMYDEELTVVGAAMHDVISLDHPNAFDLAAVTHVSAPEPLDDFPVVETLTMQQPMEPPRPEQLEALPPDPVLVWRNRKAPPRAWLVHNARVIPERIERLATLADDKLSVFETAVVETALDLEPRSSTLEPVRVMQPWCDSLVVDLEAESRGLLVVADTYGDDWCVWINGRQAEVQRVNHAFRGVVVPAGSQRVVFHYQPRGFWRGWIVSSLAIVTVVYRIRSHGRHRRHQGAYVAIAMLLVAIPATRLAGWPATRIRQVRASSPTPADGGKPFHPGPRDWRLLRNHGAPPATLRSSGESRTEVHLDPAIAETAWSVQLSSASTMPLRADTLYELSFRARASATCEVACSVGMSQAPWQSSGLYRPVRLGATWWPYRLVFRCDRETSLPRVCFDLGFAANEADGVTLEIEQVRLRSLTDPVEQRPHPRFLQQLATGGEAARLHNPVFAEESAERHIPVEQHIISPNEWWLKSEHEVAAELRREPERTDACRVEIRRAGTSDQDLMAGTELKGLRAGGRYTMRFRARGDRTRMVSWVVVKHRDQMSRRRKMWLTSEWRDFRLDFRAHREDPGTSLILLLGLTAGEIELRDLSISPTADVAES